MQKTYTSCTTCGFPVSLSLDTCPLCALPVGQEAIEFSNTWKYLTIAGIIFAIFKWSK